MICLTSLSQQKIIRCHHWKINVSNAESPQWVSGMTSKVDMSLVVVPRQGITGIQSGGEIVPVIR